MAREDELVGKNYIFIKEISPQKGITDINFNDFESKYYLKKSEFLEKINEIIELTFNIGTLPIEVESKIPRTNIRNAFPYILQHQDIIDSNSRLFYLEPKPNHFPVLAGWFGQEYYIVLKNIELLKNQIKNLIKKQEEALNTNFKLENNFRNSFRIYYSLIGLDFNENWSINDLKIRIKNIEGFKKEDYGDAIQKRQEVLEKQLANLYSTQTNLNRELSKIKGKKDQGINYKTSLEYYNERINYFDINKEYLCPICGKQDDNLSIDALQIIEAEEWLNNELLTIPTHTIIFDTEEKEILTKLKETKKQIQKLKEEFIKNNEIIEKIITEKNINELTKNGWKILVFWECQLCNLNLLNDIIKNIKYTC